jgi:succinate dehydrogenase / fumarate reductase iron-sulfur subunit
MKTNLKIFRFDPLVDKEPRYDAYTLETEVNETVLDALTTIQQTKDPDLAFRVICGNEKCGECSVLVNKIPCLACEKKVEPEITIEPLPNLPLIRDLVIDRNKVYDSLFRRIPSLLEVSQARDSKLTESHIRLTGCLECMICQSSCPVIKKKSAGFVGPLGLLWLAQRSIDMQNNDKWKTQVNTEIESCTDCGRCWKACTLEQNILEEAIVSLRNYSGKMAKGGKKKSGIS